MAFTADGYATSLLEWAANKGNDVGLPKGAMQKNLAERRRSLLDVRAKESWHQVYGPFFVFAAVNPKEF